jgi:hypothetical protein
MIAILDPKSVDDAGLVAALQLPADPEAGGRGVKHLHLVHLRDDPALDHRTGGPDHACSINIAY